MAAASLRTKHQACRRVTHAFHRRAHATVAHYPAPMHTHRAALHLQRTAPSMATLSCMAPLSLHTKHQVCRSATRACHNPAPAPTAHYLAPMRTHRVALPPAPTARSTALRYCTAHRVASTHNKPHRSVRPAVLFHNLAPAPTAHSPEVPRTRTHRACAHRSTHARGTTFNSPTARAPPQRSQLAWRRVTAREDRARVSTTT